MEMLEDAVGKDNIETGMHKGQIPTICHNIPDLYA